MEEELDLGDLTPATIKVKIGGKLYVLREASEGDVVRYDNAGMKAARMVNGQIVAVEGAADADPYLLSLCLYRADVAGNLPLTAQGEPDPAFLVPVSTIRSWKAEPVRRLIAQLKRMSGIKDAAAEKGKAEEGEAKNGGLPGPPGRGVTTPTSTSPVTSAGTSTNCSAGPGR